MQTKKGFFVDTSSEKGYVALFDEGELKVERRFRSADSLVPEMERLFQEGGVEPTELTYVGAGVGPGSFTGIRIGVMACRALAFALQIPQVGLSSLSLYRGEQPVFVDARIGGVWAQFPGQEAELISWELLPTRLQGVTKILSPEIRTLLPKLCHIGFAGAVIEGEPDGMKIGQLLKQTSPLPLGTFPPISYLRKTQAELQSE